jgi:hypothetical protein
MRLIRCSLFVLPLLRRYTFCLSIWLDRLSLRHSDGARFRHGFRDIFFTVEIIYKRACKDVLKEKPGEVDIRSLLSFSPPKIIHEFLKRVETVVWGRRLIKTGEGRLGLVPRESKEGDLICILLGCSVPVVLGRIAEEDRGAGVTLIGACYIHGMMQGKALADNSDGVYGKSGHKKFEIVSC